MAENGWKRFQSGRGAEGERKGSGRWAAGERKGTLLTLPLCTVGCWCWSWPWSIWEAIQRKNLLLFGFFSKGGRGVMSESKRFEEIFCTLQVWTIFRKGGVLPYSTLFGELLCFSLDIFKKEGGFLFQKNWGTFLLDLTFFQEREGRLPDSQDDEQVSSALA